MASKNKTFENIEMNAYLQIQESETQQPLTQEGGVKILNSDIFKVHFKKTPKENSNFDVSCNYCKQVYKFKHGGEYNTFTKHLHTKHPPMGGLVLVHSFQRTEIAGSRTVAILAELTC